MCRPSSGEDVGPSVGTAATSEDRLVVDQEPFAGIEVVVEDQGMAHHPCRDLAMCHRLPDPRVGAHCRADEPAVGRVRQDRARHVGVVGGRPGEPHPYVQLCGTNGFGIGDIDVVDDDRLGRRERVRRSPTGVRRCHGWRFSRVADQVWLVDVEEHEHPGAEPVVLGKGDRGARQVPS